MTRTKKTKTTEEITKANLKKMLDKLKIRVAEKEEIWLDTLMELIPLCKEEGCKLTESHIMYAATMSDYVIREFENRWGS